MEQRTSLRLERERRGWTQAEVAERVGATESSVSRWERGIVVPRSYHRAQLATLFGLSELALGLAAHPSSPAPASPAPSAPSPEQEATTRIDDPTLPPLPLTPIVGREQELTVLRQRLCTGHTIVLTALQGLPGVGKTTLAIGLVHDQDIRAHFADGILWVGLGPHPSVTGQLRRWGTLLGLSHSEMDELHQRNAWATALRTAIGTRRVLLVVDDVWHLEDAWPFLVAGPNCAHVVTTRFPHLAHQLVPDGATVVQELDMQQSVHLLGILAPKAVVQERQKAQELAKVVGGLPLALTLMGNYLRQQSYDGHTRRIRTAIERLSDARERLQLSAWFFSPQRYQSLSSQETVSLQSAINVSEQLLDERARQALYALSVFPAKPESFSEEAACAIADCAGETLDALVDLGLLESASADRYTLHQTVADYAAAHLQEQEPLTRLVTYCVQVLQKHEKDYDYLERESQVVLAGLEGAYRRGMHAALVQGVCTLFSFLSARGEHMLAAQLVQRAYEAVQKLDDHHAHIRVMHCQGNLLQKQGQLASAATSYHESIAYARHTDHQELLCILLNDLGWVTWKQGLYSQARTALQEGLQLARLKGYRQQQCQALSLLSALVADEGHYGASEAYAREGLNLAYELGDLEQIGFLLINLGVTLGEQQKRLESRCAFEEALSLARRIGHREWIIMLLINLGATASYDEQWEQGAAYYQEGMEVAQHTTFYEPICILHLNLGELARKQGQLADAEHHLRAAEQHAQRLGRARLHANVHYELGRLVLLQGHLEEADYRFQAMQEVMPERDPEIEALASFGMALLATHRDQSKEARRQAEKSLAQLEAMGNYAAHEVRTWIEKTCTGEAQTRLALDASPDHQAASDRLS